MNTPRVELILLLVEGSFLPVVLRREKVAEFDAMLLETLGDEERSKRWIRFTDAEGGMPRSVHPKAIIGWYFRDYAPSNSERMTKAVERLAKASEGGEGDDWKKE